MKVRHRHHWLRDAKEPWRFSCLSCTAIAVMTERGMRESRPKKRGKDGRF